MAELTPNCAACDGCNACSGCGSLLLTQDELAVLEVFAQIPFLPLARRPEDNVPVCLELPIAADRVAPVLRNMESKGLISLDYHMPLINYDYTPYALWPVRGSIALTSAGQDALDSLEVQGVE